MNIPSARNFTAEMLARSKPLATVKLPPYRVSDEALHQIEANERQAARCLTDTTLFD